MFGSKGDDQKKEGLSRDNPGWEREVVEKLAFATLSEQRRSRRWKIFFRIALLLLLAALIFNSSKPLKTKNLPGLSHTAVVEVSGIIFEGSEAEADKVISALQAAANDAGTKGVIVKINSPGGSPVQAAYIYDEIRRLKSSRPEMPFYAVVSDICASGGYYIAAAADQIIVNESSIIGSIGVVMNGFGFVDMMEKLGVERRLMTAGNKKGLLDPFSPQNESEKKHVQNLLNGIHQNFISAVKEGRGSRLVQSDEVFSGLVWLGADGIEMGLADEIGTVQSVAREKIGEPNLVNFTVRETIFDQLVKGAGRTVANTFFSGFSESSALTIR